MPFLFKNFNAEKSKKNF